MLFICTACGGTPVADLEQNLTDIWPADEYERAELYGFVAKTADPDACVTERELADSISTMLTAHDDTLTSEWSRLTKNAQSSTVKRDYGALFLLLAAERMNCA